MFSHGDISLWFSHLLVALDDLLVLLQSLEKLRERSLHRVQVTGCLVSLQQCLVEPHLGQLFFFLLKSCGVHKKKKKKRKLSQVLYMAREKKKEKLLYLPIFFASSSCNSAIAFLHRRK